MPRKGRIVALEGESAVGKSTVAALLARRVDGALLAEAYDRLRPSPSLSFRNDRELFVLETALLREEVRRYRAARALALRGLTVVADTGFLGPLSYTAGLVVLGRCAPATYARLLRAATPLLRAGSLGVADLTVLLTAPRAVLARRAARDPGRHPAEFRERHRAVGRLERSQFLGELARAFPGRVVRVSATGEPERTVGRIEKRLAGLTVLREPAGRVSALLAAWRPAPPSGTARRAATLKKGTPPARVPPP